MGMALVPRRKEPLPVEKKPALPVHLHGAEAQGDAKPRPEEVRLEAEEVGEAPLPHLPKRHLRQVPDHLPPGPPRLPLEDRLPLQGFPGEVRRDEKEARPLAEGPLGVHQKAHPEPPPPGPGEEAVGEAEEGHLLPGPDLHPAP
ncbi:hypothetical protein TthAA229_22730 (plasmid) [Thermus thermophilus]|nr:hypothetical protein TthAA220_20500 [Thermus thermophilus]BBL85792.1 hypothetical protein TthAA229_22730 [Thermus thermophilus]